MKTLRPILSILFSLLVLVSGSSFYVGLHVCGGEVKAVAVSTKAEGCQHQKQLPPCHKQITTTGCCEDKIVVHEASGLKNDVQSLSIHAGAAPYQEVIAPAVIAEIIPSVDTEPIRFFNYDTPILSEDRTVIHQVFLI